jgi:hypothetical protein
LLPVGSQIGGQYGAADTVDARINAAKIPMGTGQRIIAATSLEGVAHNVMLQVPRTAESKLATKEFYDVN